MNKFGFLLLISLTLLCGCARNYVVTLDNGRRLTTASKPKLKGGNYVYKDATGRQAMVPAARVREIAPQSMAAKDKFIFNSQPNPK